jgi:hypothetical protein
MKTMMKLVPFLVTKHTIKYDIYSLDSYDGFREGPNAVINDVTPVVFEKKRYNELDEGDIFIAVDPDGSYCCEDPSTFLMKQQASNWYLTMDTDTPLGRDRNSYCDVWAVTSK